MSGPQIHPKLGIWVNGQRRLYLHKKLKPDRIQKLESIGFVWHIQHKERKSQKWEDSWDKHYQLLLQYRNEHGDLLVPDAYTCKNGDKLGHWVRGQRTRRDLLSPKRVKTLDDIGFVWDHTSHIWWENFESLKQYHAEHGHCHVPRTTNSSLKDWTQAQRDRRKLRVAAKTGKLKYTPVTDKQIQALDSLNFPWSGDGSHCQNDSDAKKAYQEQIWRQGFEKLKKFQEDHGHCLATKRTDASVASWVKTQRHLYKEGKLSREKIDLLEAIGFTDWTGTQLKTAKARESWTLRFEELREFRRVNGHSRVPGPAERKQEDEERLASLYSWVAGQRERRFNPRRPRRPISQDEIDQLNSIDFVWDVGLDARWEERLRRLRRYKMEHGNCLVPTTYEYDQDLANWVSNQRTEYRNGNISNDRIERLDGIGFVWRVVYKAGDPYVEEFEKKWDLKYEKLQLFQEEFGHCFVPGDYGKDKSLGRWVAKQRKMFREKRMPARRKKLLDSLGFVWKVDFYQSDKSIQQRNWDEMFTQLNSYKESFGHLNIRHDYATEDGSKLGQWVTLQRSGFRDGTIEEKRKTLLESIGFLWKASGGVSPTKNSAGRHDDVSDDESVVAIRPQKRLRPLRIAEDDGL